MAKKLKIWNGRGWGRSNYGRDGDKLPTSFYQFADHIYVCAHSKAEAIRMVNDCGTGHISISEVNNYWSSCWGTSMKDIEPELGIWATQKGNDKPVKIYPKEEEDNA
jgi:hypothetical protein